MSFNNAADMAIVVIVFVLLTTLCGAPLWMADMGFDVAGLLREEPRQAFTAPQTQPQYAPQYSPPQPGPVDQQPAPPPVVGQCWISSKQAWGPCPYGVPAGAAVP